MTTEPQPAPPAPAPAPTIAPPVVPTSQAKFTQEELQAHATREAAEARRTALREISDKLGCTVEEAEQILHDRREADEARLSELEKRERALATKEQGIAAREAEVDKITHTNRVRNALLAAGIRPDRVEHVNVNVPADADDNALQVAVAAYKGQVPEFFTSTPPPAPTPTTTPSGDPGGTPRAPAPATSDAFARGAERAKEYKFGDGSLV